MRNQARTQMAPSLKQPWLWQDLPVRPSLCVHLWTCITFIHVFVSIDCSQEIYTPCLASIGSGKTAAIGACAEELGYSILEVNLFGQCCGKQVSGSHEIWTRMDSGVYIPRREHKHIPFSTRRLYLLTAMTTFNQQWLSLIQESTQSHHVSCRASDQRPKSADPDESILAPPPAKKGEQINPSIIHTYIHTYIRTYIHTYIHMKVIRERKIERVSYRSRKNTQWSQSISLPCCVLYSCVPHVLFYSCCS